MVFRWHLERNNKQQQQISLLSFHFHFFFIPRLERAPQVSYKKNTHFLTVFLLLLLCSFLYEKASLKWGLSPSLQHGRMCKWWLGVANAPGKSQQLGFVRRVEPTNRKSIFYLSFIFNSNYLSPSPIDLFRVIAVSYHIKLSFSFDAAFDFPLFS